jgi:hypothetical protein
MTAALRMYQIATGRSTADRAAVALLADAARTPEPPKPNGLRITVDPSIRM